jgi:hypothetical protein
MRLFSNQSRVWAVAIGLAMAIPVAISGQQRSDAQAAVEVAKSQQLVADLAAIQSDRAAAENALIAKWEAALDPGQYNLRSELASIVSRTPDWQLYGASKATDFATMSAILRGTSSAAAAINAAGGTGVSHYVGEALGSAVNSLVYTPIPPCRMVDTRGVGARTGLMPANSTRTFDLTTDGYGKGQGGSTSGCAALPSYSHAGWAVNITVTGYGGNGWLTIWPFLGTEPFVSQINFATGIWSVANGLNLTGCDGCFDDITIRAANNATHVIIDVIGFYEQATASASDVTRVAGTSGTSTAGSRAFFSGGACPAGTVLVGGDVDHGSPETLIGEAHGFTTTWTAWIVNNDVVNTTVTVYSRCLETPVQVF